MQVSSALIWVAIIMVVVLVVGTIKSMNDQRKGAVWPPDPSAIKVDWIQVVVALALMAGTLFGAFVKSNLLMYGGLVLILFDYLVIWRLKQKRAK